MPSWRRLTSVKVKKTGLTWLVRNWTANAGAGARVSTPIAPTTKIWYNFAAFLTHTGQKQNRCVKRLK